HVFEVVVSLPETICDRNRAAAVIRIKKRDVLAGEDVACMDGSERWEEDPRVAVGMAASEVVQIDLVGALEKGHLVLECALRQPPAVVGLEYCLGRHGLILRRAVG